MAELRERVDARTAAIFATFCAFGAALFWSRFVGLNQSLWHDEITTVVRFVRQGPTEIFLGDYIPNNHMLFSFLTWLTSAALGESEVVYRLWSVVPFALGVVLAARWLHRREGAFAAAAFAFLAIQSPLLLEVSRQARGYGFAFLAMVVMTFSAWRMLETEKRSPVIAFTAAGVLGTWDLPVFGVAFASVGLVLLTQSAVRRQLAPWFLGSLAAVLFWYLPVLDWLVANSDQQYGHRVAWYGVALRPLQLFTPALAGNGNGHQHAGLIACLVFGPLLALGIAVTYRRSRALAAVLVAGVLGTDLVFWLGELYVEARFASYLLVPLFILASIGASRLLEWIRASRSRARLGFELLGGLLVAWMVALFLAYGWIRTRYPAESWKEAATAIRELPATTTIVVSAAHPSDLAFYLGRGVTALNPTHTEKLVCGHDQSVVFVAQHFGTPPEYECFRRRGVQHRRLRQFRSYGDSINIWYIPQLKD